MRQLKKEFWPYSTRLYNVADNVDPDKWCRETVGYRFKDWYSYSFDSKERMYAFKDEATLLVFKLKWGNYASR